MLYNLKQYNAITGLLAQQLLASYILPAASSVRVFHQCFKPATAIFTESGFLVEAAWEVLGRGAQLLFDG